MLGARLLGAALECGLIDRLIAGPLATGEAAARFALAPRGAELLLAGLKAGGVIETRDGQASLTPAFIQALAWRDLLEAKLAFADLVLPDIGGLTLPLLSDGGEFIARSQTFELFRYDRAKHRSAKNRADTERWVALTTVLTRYEAPGLLQLLDFGGVHRTLDVGGNSGELARAIVEAHPQVQATVFDLPVVCDIGRDHLAGSARAGSVTFIEGDLRQDALPGGMDLVTFKSVLHDWPQEHAAAFLAKAAQALAPGGRIAIFERAPFDFGAALPAYHDLPNLMFLHFLREPDIYRGMLERLGLEVTAQVRTVLDMPFFLLTARKR
jgi:SAM-dependent methyltransferase